MAEVNSRTNMDSTGPNSITQIPINLVHKGKERKCNLPTYKQVEYVVQFTRETLKLHPHQGINLKWIDDDGDPITLESQRDWDELLRLFPYNQDGLIYFHVFEGPKPQPGQLCEGEDINLYKRRGAKRWKKQLRLNGHIFQAKRLNTAYCIICNDHIWGLGRQGFRCTQCKIIVHKRCVKFVRQICDGQVSRPDGTQVSDRQSSPRDERIRRVRQQPKGNPVFDSTISIDDFNILKVIGRGSYAKVLLAEQKKTSKLYAMKVVKKELLTDEEDFDWVQTEKHVFEVASNHPYLVGLHSCFQSESRLFFVIEFVRGGDLMFHMQRQRKLPEDHSRFYASEICLALNYLHERGIVYRDLKLDNVLLDEDGHIKLTDYGMCKEGLLKDDTTNTFCGTPNYIAPEIIRGQSYSYSVDWWALGVLLYEMLVGRSPFDVTGHHEAGDATEDLLFQMILEKTIRVPRSLSVRAANVLKGFLTKNPKERLGCHPETGFNDIKSHQFFRSIEWKQLEMREVESPFIPRTEDERDVINFDPQFTNEPLEFTPVDKGVLERIDQAEFEGFEYVNPLFMTQEDQV
ncbi:aPKC [Oopsacas minuta]|uniref:Protein kinase C n=1 Tax=Oopsacas minuta TaxID=111878 RepID=A0A2P1GIW6_9METZ|nr:aPKC [Oopsacas minuta]KAI6650752.1 aPKC [Oopsacas minuta]